MGLDNPLHIAFLLILLLLVFGAKRLPEMGRSLGTGMRGFKDSLNGESTQSSLSTHQQEAVAPTAPAQAPVVSTLNGSAPVASTVNGPTPAA
jgi:sec-independent protein translocase protein TatA